MSKKRQTHWLPLDKPPRTWPIVGFDVEGTGDVGGFIYGVIYEQKGARGFTNRDDMAKALLGHKYRGARIYAHNLEYDFGCLFQDSMEGWSLYRLNSKLIKAIHDNGRKNTHRLFDTCNLSNYRSLAAIGQIMGYEKLETPEWLKVEGGCAKKRDELTDDQRQTLKIYCRRDAEIVYRFASFIQETINELGGEIKSTIASTGMDVFKRSYLKAPIKTPHPLTNELCREGYYGGRCEVYRFGTLPGSYLYDVNSMYPAVMSKIDLPDPSDYYYFEYNHKVSIILDYEGMTKCTVRAPSMHVPVLPVRVKDRLMFPTGEFEGAWCHNELRKAIDLGYEILNIKWQIRSRKTMNPFKAYVADLHERKQAAKRKGEPVYFIYKLLLNSIYGKLGQRSDDSYTQMRRIDTIDDFLEKVGIDIIEWQGDHYVVEPACGPLQPSYINVMWAAYVTAAARLRLYDLLMEYDRELAYCDTDSALGSHPLEETQELGGLGLEIGPATFEIRSEKNYRWQDEDALWSYKKAGVPRDLQAEFWQVGRVTYQRPTKIGEAMRDDVRFSVWRDQVKTDRPRHTKRCPRIESWPDAGYVDSRPWTYEEAVSLYENARPMIPWRGKRFVGENELARQEIEQMDRLKLQAQIDALRQGLTIPIEIIHELYDWRVGAFRRVRNGRNELTLGAYARVDVLADENGYQDGEHLKEDIRQHVGVYERIRELKARQDSLGQDLFDDLDDDDEIPF